ncbi:MAG: type II toxin-antitoxin system VapC family toxin [Acidimicrobiales bacterium]
MVLDTSALVAILLHEPERDAFLDAVAAAPTRLVSAATLVEASVVLERRRGDHAGRELDLLVHRAGIRVVAVDGDQAELARGAWRRYGKSRHPAALNYGDLFSYALARATGEPLLYKGDDFAKTDLGARA